MIIHKHKVTLSKLFTLLIISQYSLLAIECQITGISSINFGSIYPLTSSQVTTSLTFNYKCTNGILGNLLAPSTFCFNIGNSSVSSTINPRQMKNLSNNTLNYQLYKNNTYTDIWGSQNQTGGTPTILNSTINLSSFSGSLTIYAKINDTYNNLIPGTYTDNYTATTAFITANPGLLVAPGSCGSTVVATFTFAITAVVEKEFKINASSDINFGSVNINGSNFVANNTITTICSNLTPYTIGLLPLNNNPNGVGEMINTQDATKKVPYQLSTTSTPINIWGNSSTNMVSKIGNGKTQNNSAYAIIPSINNYTPGSYKDSVTVTITY